MQLKLSSIYLRVISKIINEKTMQSRILLNINYATTINKLSGNLITRWFFVGKTENSVKVLILFFEKHTMSEAAIPVMEFDLLGS